MEEFKEELMSGQLISIDADSGSTVMYIDKNLEIRTQCVNRSHRFMPFFSVTHVSKDMLDFLKQCLRDALPDADEMRYIYDNNGFFLCVIRFLR